ncbi:MAG: radical SAM family heme chaperone HemW [Deltaproteobacteria bacterium]|nr:radical SAM family heme chaperone HemW [Deltaproteobacteria bacterium]
MTERGHGLTQGGSTKHGATRDGPAKRGATRLRSTSDGRNPEPFSLYVHIPYCVSKCPYCDFNSHVATRIPEEEYTRALLRELHHYSESEAWTGRPVKTVFFGGGTPSTFHGRSIGTILDEAAKLFGFDERTEITLEANPGVVDAGRFRDYRTNGVNRISIGAQSFDPELLRFLGRVHSADETRRALSGIREAGFDNFSLDLIYGIPDQTVDGVSRDLSAALAYEPPHLSAYNLTIEEGTPFHARYRQGLLRPLDEEVEIAMAERIQRTLEQAGLERYEISNYARPGLESRHNVNYWRGGDYLGIGAGAHSYHRPPEDPLGERWQNERLPTGYMRLASEAGHAVTECERQELRQAMAEHLFTGLRMIGGVSVHGFCRRFGTKPEDAFPDIAGWLSEGLLVEDGWRLRFAPRGLLLANELFVRLV